MFGIHVQRWGNVSCGARSAALVGQGSVCQGLVARSRVAAGVPGWHTQLIGAPAASFATDSIASLASDDDQEREYPVEVEGEEGRISDVAGAGNPTSRGLHLLFTRPSPSWAQS